MQVYVKERYEKYASGGELPDDLARWLRRVALRTGATTADVIAGCIAHCADGRHFTDDERKLALGSRG